MQPGPDRPSDLDVLVRRLSAQRGSERPCHGAAADAAPLPGRARRDRAWQWSDWLFLPGLLIVLVGACCLLGHLSPVPIQVANQASLRGNLNASAPAGTTVRTRIVIAGGDDRPRWLRLAFSKQARPDTWNLTGSIAPADGKLLAGTVAGITFNRDGSFSHVKERPVMVFRLADDVEPRTLTFHLGTPGGFDGVTQLPDPNLLLPNPILAAAGPSLPLPLVPILWTVPAVAIAWPSCPAFRTQRLLLARR
jgi:hypothetical protein